MADPAAIEAFYDTEIAPALADLCAKCTARGMSFVALVEWSLEGRGTTHQAQPDASLDFRTAAYMALPGRTLDGLVRKIAEHVVEHEIDHNSHALEAAGIPALVEDRRTTTENFDGYGDET